MGAQDNITSDSLLQTTLPPTLLSEGSAHQRGASNALSIAVPRLAAVAGEAVYRVTISALSTAGTNAINPVRPHHHRLMKSEREFVR